MSQAIRAPLTLFLTGAFVLSPLFSSGFAGFSKDQFPVVLDHWPAQPAGWAFSIWGVIYGWLLASAVFGLWKRPKSPEWQGMRIALCISLAVGTFWIAVANTAPVLATGMILVMAVTAILAACRTGRADPWMLAGPGRPVCRLAYGCDGCGICCNHSGLRPPQWADRSDIGHTGCAWCWPGHTEPHPACGDIPVGDCLGAGRDHRGKYRPTALAHRRSCRFWHNRLCPAGMAFAPSLDAPSRK